MEFQSDQEGHGRHPFQGLKLVLSKPIQEMAYHLTQNSNPRAEEKQKEKM